MAAWNVRSLFRDFGKPHAPTCRPQGRLVDESPNRIRRTATRLGDRFRAKACGARHAGQTPVQTPRLPILPEARLQTITVRASLLRRLPRNAGHAARVWRRSPVREPAFCSGRETHQLESGHRCLVSGGLRAISCKRQRGRPETRQSGGQSVPVDAAPRCRCHHRADRSAQARRPGPQALQNDGRTAFLQVRGNSTCRS
jgi:hypothetical protein